MTKIALERPTDLPHAQPSRLATKLVIDAPDSTSPRRRGEVDRAAGPSATLSDGDDVAVAYRDHHVAVAAAARRICGPHHAADVTQDVFLILSRHPERFDPDRGTLRSFLLAIAHHRAVDVVRSEMSRRSREDRVDASEPPAPAEVDENLLRREGGTRVRAALAALPAPERDAIITAFYGRCSYREAAARLGQPEGTIKSRIRTGIQRLRPVLTSPDAGCAHPSGHG